MSVHGFYGCAEFCTRKMLPGFQHCFIGTAGDEIDANLTEEDPPERNFLKHM